MGRCTRNWLWAVALVFLAENAGAELVGPRMEGMQKFAAISKSASPRGLRIALEAGSGDTVAIGSSTRFEIEADEAGFLTLLCLDGNGGMEIWLDGNDESAELFSGVARSLPDEFAAFSGKAAPPIGVNTVMAIATPGPLDFGPLAAVVRQSGGRFVPPAGVGPFLSALGTHLEKTYSNGFAAGQIDYRVEARSKEVEYAAADIESFFASGTRGIRGDGLPVRVLFAFDSAQIAPSSKPSLEEVGIAFSRKSTMGYKFEVAGHSDDIGEEMYNTNLGMNRAIVVRDYLVKHYGIERERLIVRSYGESEPRESNENELGRHNNRRVEFIRLP